MEEKIFQESLDLLDANERLERTVKNNMYSLIETVKNSIDTIQNILNH